MVVIRSVNDISEALREFFQTAQPNLSVIPGSVASDLFVDAPASQLALIYDELSKSSNLQSLRLVSGSDLDKLASNYGASRKTATKSSGTALLTFATIPAVVAINPGSIITASNGSTFSITNGVSVDPANINLYKSIATKYANDLNFLNITDLYAVEVTVQSTASGSSGNIAKYSLNSTQINGVSNVTNTFPFLGGTDQETDSAFRTRVLSIFSGSNIGTSLGYKNLALSDSDVSDAIVIGPGSPLMTRDGTQTITNADGSITISSEGTGGKVDIIILGSVLTTTSDTFIYTDKSNKNDPTNSSNNFVLGQIVADANLTITQKRINDIANGTLPTQPIEAVLQVTGTLSGGNFIPMTTDSLGRISGNYQLVKDTGNYAGSPWGQDYFHWTSNQITMFSEDIVKSAFNGQDGTTYTDVLQIPEVQQNISITNENSNISIDRSIIQLLHTPATNTTRVFNTNTGETYIVINQNLDGTGSINSTGRIQISGNTLPATSDVLQVDYTWIVSYDEFSDFDGKILNNNPRPISDSVDWGISNAIRNERQLFTLNNTNTIYTGTTKLPISSVISANTFSNTNGTILLSNLSNYSNRLIINLIGLDDPINSIEKLTLQNTNQELYNTSEADGIIINNRVSINFQIKYNVSIILPSDTSAIINDYANIIYNQTDLFNITGSTGSFVLNNITIPSTNLLSEPLQVYLDITYIAAVQNILTASVVNFPISKAGNGFILNSNVEITNNTKPDTVRKENQTIQINTSDQLFINLTISSTDYNLIPSQIITVIDLATGLEIWNNDYPGILTNDSNGNYQLIFSGFNSPKTGDNVLIVYFADDINRVQPFTYNDSIISRDFQTLQFNFTTNNFYVPFHTFINESSIAFSIIDSTTGIAIVSGTDGYISSNFNSDAYFSSLSVNFYNVDDILGKYITIHHPINPNNYGTFNITYINSTMNIIEIESSKNNLNANQISIIRLADGKDLWNNTGTLDYINNIINLPVNSNAFAGDKILVLLINQAVLHQSLTKLALTVSDQVQNKGVITVSGTTITKVENIVFTAINNGLTQDVLEAMRTFLNITSTLSISTNNYLARIMKLEKVSTTTNNDVLSVITTFDIFGTTLNDNSFYSNEMLFNDNLQKLNFTLPSSVNNLANNIKIGDKLRISFYFATDSDSENLSFTKNGTVYSNKRFASVDQIYIASGFNSSTSAQFVMAYFTQPITNSRYTAFYNYLAPKQNERILISYNYNSVITDVTFNVENSRPINADVLVKEAKQLLTDATVNIVVSSSYSSSAPVVLQNVNNAIVSAINTNTLGAVLSSSDLIVAAQAVSGVERARILTFNQDGKTGQVLTLTCQENQYFVANNILVNQESI